MNKTESTNSIQGPRSTYSASEQKLQQVAKSASTYKPQINIERPRDVATEESEIGKRSSSSKRQNRNYQKRVETTGEKQSEQQIQQMGEDDMPQGSVNIQTDAISFDNNAQEQKSSTTYGDLKKQRSQVSFKSRSSKRSGGPPLPPSIYGQTQQQRKTAKNTTAAPTNTKVESSQKPDTLNVSQLLNEQQPVDQINKLIQRDNARMVANTSIEQANLLVPNYQDSQQNQGLLLPSFPKTLQKQTTGRNDKKVNNKELMMHNDSSNASLLLAPNFVIQRGLTKQEEKKDQDKDTLDQQSAQLNVKSIKSITRPSNVSGMASVISPDSNYQPNDVESNDSRSDFFKPSVRFDMLDQVTEKTGGNRSDLKSQKSVKFDDSKTIVTVETAIQILEPSNENKNVTESPNDTQQPKTSQIDPKKNIAQAQKLSTFHSGKSGGTNKTNQKVAPIPTTTAAGKKINNVSADKSGSGGGVAKTFVQPVSKNKLLSSRAQRDIMSDKGAADGGVSPINISHVLNSESPLNSPELGVSIASIGDQSNSGFKRNQNGLLSIKEQKEEQQPVINVGSLEETSNHTAKKSPKLDSTKNKNKNKDVEVSSHDASQRTELLTQQKQPYDAITDLKDETESVKTKTSKKSKKGPSMKKFKQKKVEAEEVEVEWKPQRLMQFQMYAADFYRNTAGGGGLGYPGYSDDPARIAEFLGQEERKVEMPEQMDTETAPLSLPQATSDGSKDLSRQDMFSELDKEMDEVKEEPETSPDASPGLKRQDAIQETKQELDAELKKKDQLNRELEAQIAQLKEVIKIQTNQSQQAQKPRRRSTIVGNNQGYIGAIHQPTYNINLFQSDNSPSRANFSDQNVNRQPQQQQHQQQQQQRNPQYFGMSKPSRPNSSNIYASNNSAAAQNKDGVQTRKKRPMTAAGAGAKRFVQQNQIDQEQQFQSEQPASEIDFKIATRPISAATYQKQASRNNQRHFFSDGQVSDQRFNQDNAINQILERINSNNEYVPQVGQTQQDKQSMLEMKEVIALKELISQGHNFHPRTNLGSTQGVQRTQSCYLNVFNKKSAKGIMPNTQYVQTNAGKTGYVSVPNKSQKILQQAYKVESKTLTKQNPLGMSTEPMRSLKGCILNEMIHLHKQKNRRKHAFVNSKDKLKDAAKRLQRMKNQPQRRQGHQNEDLLIQQVDECIENDFNDQSAKPGQKNNKVVGSQQNSDDSGSTQSIDSNDSVPGLTGGGHILMMRNVFEDNYELSKQGKVVPLKDTHFQPIFFAKNTDVLREDTKAQKALKQYRIFVTPEEMHQKCEKKPLTTMQLDIAEKLEKRIETQQKLDLEVYYSQKTRKENLVHRQENLVHTANPSKIASNYSSKQSNEESTRNSRKVSGGSKKPFMRDSSPNIKRMMYKIGAQSKQSLLHNIRENTSAMRVSTATKDMNYFNKQSTGSLTSPSPMRVTDQQRSSFSKPRPSLNVKQQSFVNRMSVRTEPRTRRMLRERLSIVNAGQILTQEKQAVVGASNAANSPNDSTSPPSKKQQSSKMIKESSIQSVSSDGDDRSSNLFSIVGKNSPAQSAAKKKKGSKLTKSVSTDKGMVNSSGFRPFSASTGGGLYPSRLQQQVLTQTQRDEVNEKLKKSNTPKVNEMNSQSIFQKKKQSQDKSLAASNSGQMIINEQHSRKPPRKQEKSVTSAGSNRLASKSNLQQRRVTTSSDIHTNKSQSQLTGIGTDRRTDTTAALKAKKNIDSKMSETVTNTESEMTAKTRTEKVPQNINFQVIIPTLSVRLDSDSDMVKKSDEEELKLKKRDFSVEPLQNTPLIPEIVSSQEDVTPMVKGGELGMFPDKVQSESDKTPINQSPSNINVSVTPLDGVGRLNSNENLLSPSGNFVSTFKSKDTEALFVDGDEFISKPSGTFFQLLIENDDNSVVKKDLMPSPSLESRTQFLLEDSRDSLTDHVMPQPQQEKEGDPQKENINKEDQDHQKDLKELTSAAIQIDGASRNELEISKLVSRESERRSQQSQTKVPTLMINYIEQRSRQPGSVLSQTQDGEDLLKSLQKITTSKNPNTDRHMTKDLSKEQDSSQTSRNERANLEANLVQALHVPQKTQLRHRIPSKDSMSSVLTPMFPRDKRRQGENTPSAASHSDFSFAADLNRSQIMMGDKNESQGSTNQDRHQTKRQATNFLLPSMTSKKKSDSRTGSHNEGYIDSEATSEDRKRLIGDNIDLLELGASENDRQDLVGATPKSAQANVKPIFQVVQQKGSKQNK